MAAVTLSAIGAATAIAGAGMSLAQASKQGKMVSEAEMQAAKSMSEARKNLGKNYFEPLNVQREQYEAISEGYASQAKEALQAGQEGERGASVVAGKVLMGYNDAEQQIRQKEAQDLQNLEMIKAKEDSRLRDVNTELSLKQTQGAQQAAADAQRAQAASIGQGIGALQVGVQQGIQMLPLYPQIGGGTGNPALKNPNKIGTVQPNQFQPSAGQTTAAFNNAVFGSPLSQTLQNPQYRTAIYPNQSQIITDYMQLQGASMNPFMIYQ